jgi:solute carrier family 35 (UDP-sugar transporter), member A1/2/3
MDVEDQDTMALLQPGATEVESLPQAPLIVMSPGTNKKQSLPGSANAGTGGGISAMGLKVLILLAVQNSSKNLLMRYVMKEKPQFLTSAAVIGSECTKLTLSTLYILLIEKKSLASIVQYFHDDWKNTLLVAVPASAYNLQMTLEYIALANLDAAMFSVLVQTKLLFTASFAAVVIAQRLKYIQVISLALLTVGVMLCNMRFGNDGDDAADKSSTTGILATLGIAVSSGFASVYTEKVIKTQRQVSPVSGQYSLAYTQVQLAMMSLVTIGVYACVMDFRPIIEYGLFHNFNGGAILTVFNSALGGLIVAAVLKVRCMGHYNIIVFYRRSQKNLRVWRVMSTETTNSITHHIHVHPPPSQYADSVLKGYATAISVIMTGLLSMVLFGTKLHAVYLMGIINVVVAVLLYNGKNLDQYVCS